MIRSQVTKTRSIYFSFGDVIDNLNESQRDYLRHVLQCEHDLKDVNMMITPDGRLCFWCDHDLTIDEEVC